MTGKVGEFCYKRPVTLDIIWTTGTKHNDTKRN